MTASSEIIRAPLASVCRLVTDGTHDTPKRVEIGFPLIKAKEIVGGQIDFDNCDQISLSDHLAVIARSKPEFGDTLFAHIGASLGEAAFVGTAREFSIKNIALFKPNPNVIDPRYLHYVIIGPEFQSTAKAVKTGAAQPFLGLAQLRAHPIRYHRSLQTQRRIADILSAYDDLIEVNQRRIAILEEMARRLFEEWFVRFRYPGHEGDAIVNTAAGPAPRGWEVGAISRWAKVQRGRSYRGHELVEEGRPFVTLKCILRDGGFRRDGLKSFEGDAKSEHHLCAGDIVIAVTDMTQERRIVAQAARVPPLPDRAVFSMDLVKLHPFDQSHREFFYAMWRWSGCADRLRHHANGANVLHLGADRIATFEFAFPGSQLARTFSERVSPLFSLIDTLGLASESLRAARDLLLPKLISGEIELKAAPAPDDSATRTAA